MQASSVARRLFHTESGNVAVGESNIGAVNNAIIPERNSDIITTMWCARWQYHGPSVASRTEYAIPTKVAFRHRGAWYVGRKRMTLVIGRIGREIALHGLRWCEILAITGADDVQAININIDNWANPVELDELREWGYCRALDVKLDYPQTG